MAYKYLPPTPKKEPTKPPVVPWSPVIPTTPTTPTTPTAPSVPTTPTTPTAPSVPTTPAVPSTPAIPGAPSIPTTPSTPTSTPTTPWSYITGGASPTPTSTSNAAPVSPSQGAEGTQLEQSQAKAFTQLPQWAPPGSKYIMAEGGEWVIKGSDGKYYDLQGNEIDIEGGDESTGVQTFQDPSTGQWFYMNGMDELGNPKWSPFSPEQTGQTHKEIQTINGKQVVVTIDDTTGQIIDYGTSYGEAAEQPLPWATGTNQQTGEQGYGQYMPVGNTLQWAPETFQSTEPSHIEVRNVNGRNIEVKVSDRTGQVLEYGNDYGAAPQNTPLPEGFPQTYQDQNTGYVMAWNPTEGRYVATGTISGWMDPTLQWTQQQWGMEHPNVGTISGWSPSAGSEPSRQEYDAWPSDMKQAYANSIAAGILKAPFWWGNKSSGGNQTYSRIPSWTGFKQY